MIYYIFAALMLMAALIGQAARAPLSLTEALSGLSLMAFMILLNAEADALSRMIKGARRS